MKQLLLVLLPPALLNRNLQRAATLVLLLTAGVVITAVETTMHETVHPFLLPLILEDKLIVIIFRVGSLQETA